MYGAHGAGIGIGALVSHDTDRHHGQQHGERLPDLAVQAGSFYFADYDLVRLLQKRDALSGDFAKDANSQAWPGEGLTLQDLLRHAEVASDAADLVFE